MNRAQISTNDFNYDLPDERIAKFPLADRNESKLLVYRNGDIQEGVFNNLEQHLPASSMLVFNDTKVLTARMVFQKTTGAHIEIFCLEPYESTVEEALCTTERSIWTCMVGNLRKFGLDTTLVLTIAGVNLKASIHKKRENDLLIQFEWDGGIEFSRVLEAAGKIPLPPYLNRKAIDADKENYQTVYAKNLGAVAAPTAGLHFVPEQLAQLQTNGHAVTNLTLYVGAGTFRVVKADKLVDHAMHEERIVISKEAIEGFISHTGKLITVGTTSLRSMESLYWLAVKMDAEGAGSWLDVSQNDPYELESDWDFKNSCEYILSILNKKGLNEVDFNSSILIMPSYNWKAIDGLITNFHQPKSTLLALIASWIGDDWKTVYSYAMEHDFRFLSYGDSSLLLKD